MSTRVRWWLRAGWADRGGVRAAADPGPSGDRGQGAVVAWSGGGDLRGRADRVRAGPVPDRHGVACQVAPPSKLQRPCGDRVKTDLLTELPGRCAGRDVHARAGLARFPRHDQRRGLSPRELSELVVPLARSLEATGD